MAANPQPPADWRARRERFRAYMKAFNPNAPANEPIASGLVSADLHDALFEKIAARAEIEPGSQQVLLGGTGSGKTTELLLVQESLRKRGLQALYMEASRYTDLAKAGPGTLAAMVGIELLRITKGNEGIAADARVVERFAVGEWQQLGYYGDYEDECPGPDVGFISGKLVSPIAPAIREVHRIKEPLQNLLNAARQSSDVVALFDGLDRLPAGSRFWELTSADLALFKELELPVVTVAPWSMLYEPASQISERFDRVHELKAETYSDRRSRLRNLLEKRDIVKLLDPAAMDRICDASGGVIRDVITLARDAGEQAYVTDADAIGGVEVNCAVDNLGQSYRRGLSPSQVATLRSWNESQSFDPSRQEVLDLLMTRRVLERSQRKYAVHPALASVLT